MTTIVRFSGLAFAGICVFLLGSLRLSRCGTVAAGTVAQSADGKKPEAYLLEQAPPHLDQAFYLHQGFDPAGQP